MPSGATPERQAKSLPLGRETPISSPKRDTARPLPTDGTDPDLALANELRSSTPADVTFDSSFPAGFEALTELTPQGPQSLIGTTFGDFELLAEIGRGGMGVVYKARQLSLDRAVALKMLLTEHAQNATVLARFQTEARTAAALDHTNIVKVFQVGEGPLGHFFVMELIDGPTLEAAIQRGPLPVNNAIALSIMVAEALHYAHGKGVIHRDLKPANIMLDRLRRPVVMDFGIAKFVGRSTALTQEGAIMGTPGYMPPEQAGEDHTNVGPHSDVYSLGAILYSMLSGKPPFEESTALKTILKVISEDMPTPVHTHRADVPPLLEQVCMKCLQKKPADRYLTAHDFALDLRRVRANLNKPAVAAKPQPLAFLVEATTKKQIPLVEGTHIIGRASDCDIVVRSSEVSKRHCQIIVNSDGLQVEDLSSSNGTNVNGRRIERYKLKNGDKLDVSGRVFRVVLPTKD